MRTHMHRLAAALRSCAEEAQDGSQVLGPAPAPVSRIKGRYRYHLMLKCPDSTSVHRILDRASALVRGPSGAKVIIDIDPISML